MYFPQVSAEQKHDADAISNPECRGEMWKNCDLPFSINVSSWSVTVPNKANSFIVVTYTEVGKP